MLQFRFRVMSNLVSYCLALFELIIFSESKSRQKRHLYVNTEAEISAGFLISFPISYALPTFNLYPPGRSFRNKRSTANDIEILPENSYDPPEYQYEIEKISQYLSSLEIHQDICQLKIICQVYSEPQVYKPLIQILDNKLNYNQGLIEEMVENRYYRYILAMNEGITGNDKDICSQKYFQCPYDAQDRLNPTVLQMWNFFTRLLKIEFID